jgi:AcrR family transcriptional regulator
MARTATRPKKRDITRARVIQAAIDCIYEEGFHTAHTNRIAERAEVTWGVLQYHFGDKDGLLQAVLDSIFADFAASLEQADPGEADLKQRVDQLIGLIWSLVSERKYRVSMAILRNAGLSSDSSVSGTDQLNQWAEEIARLWDRQFEGLIASPARSDSARRIMFAALRGFADELNPSGVSARQLEREFSALGDAIYHLLSH